MAEVIESKDLAVPETIVPPLEAPTPTQIDLEQPIFTIPSRNIKVRAMRHSDAPGFAQGGNNKKISQNMRERWPEPYTEDAGHDFIAGIRKQDNWTCTTTGYPHAAGKKPKGTKLPSAWTITLDDKVIGSMGYEFSNDTQVRAVSVGYWIAEEHWGKGLGTDVMTAFVSWFWRTFPYIVRLEAMVYAWNPASGRVLEKSGFQLEGRLKASVWRYGRLTDVLIYGLVREGTETTLRQPALDP